MTRLFRFSNALMRAGPLGRELGTRLDLVRTIGPGWAWRRLRIEAQRSRLEASSAYHTIWQDAARSVDAEFTELSGGIFEIRKNSRSTRIYRQYVQLDDAVTLRFALEKTAVYRLLADAGLAVPEHLEFPRRDSAPAYHFLDAGPTPCVVKPAAESNGGSGATTGITSERQLSSACLRAGRIAEKLVIERQGVGHVYRLLFLDGELIDIVRKCPPTVRGDGRSTVGELITAENQRRLGAEGPGCPLLRIDLDCAFTLANAGLTLNTVLLAEATVAVKTVTNQNAADDNHTVHDTVCDEIVQEAAEAARLVGVRLAGVDLITADVAKPLAAAGGVLLEVNGGPGLTHHYRVADESRATPVARIILSRLLGLDSPGRA